MLFIYFFRTCNRNHSHLKLHIPLYLDVTSNVSIQLLKHRLKRGKGLMILEIFVEESGIFFSSLSQMVNLENVRMWKFHCRLKLLSFYRDVRSYWLDLGRLSKGGLFVRTEKCNALDHGRGFTKKESIIPMFVTCLCSNLCMSWFLWHVGWGIWMKRFLICSATAIASRQKNYRVIEYCKMIDKMNVWRISAHGKAKP